MDRRELLGLIGLAAPALAGKGPRALYAATLEVRARATAPARTAFLDPHQHALVDQISELIIPATDTPGARAALVADFVDVIVGEWYHDDERAAFLRGLADVDSRAQADFTRGFLELTEAQQTAILTGLEAEARAMPPGSPPPFFSRIKGMTLFGYYTSEIGSTQELHEVFMPGRFDGSAPLRAPAAGGR
jgi:hypothetical protein